MKQNDVAVLYIVTKLELGGAQKVCLALMEGAIENGLQAGLIAGSQGVLVSQIPKTENVFLLDSFKREVGIKFIFKEMNAFFQIFKIIRRLRKEYVEKQIVSVFLSIMHKDWVRLRVVGAEM